MREVSSLFRIRVLPGRIVIRVRQFKGEKTNESSNLQNFYIYAEILAFGDDGSFGRKYGYGTGAG